MPVMRAQELERGRGRDEASEAPPERPTRRRRPAHAECVFLARPMPEGARRQLKT